MLLLLCFLTDHVACPWFWLLSGGLTDCAFLCLYLPSMSLFLPQSFDFLRWSFQNGVHRWGFQSNFTLNNISDQVNTLKSKWPEQSRDKIWEKSHMPISKWNLHVSRAFPSLHCCAWPCQGLPVVNSSYNARKSEPSTVWNRAHSEYRLRPSRVLPECEQLSVVISCSILEALYWCYLTSHFLSPLLFSPPRLSALLWLLSPVPLCMKARMLLYCFTGPLCAPVAVGVVKCF